MASAARFLWNTNDIEDTVLDAFTATWQNLHKLPHPKDASRFLFFVLKRKCINKNRHEKGKNEFSVYSIESDEEDYNLIEISSLITIDFVEKFEKYVAANCTKRQKQIMNHFMLGRNNIEIGAALGINHRTVSSIKLNVFDGFKKRLANEDKL